MKIFYYGLSVAISVGAALFAATAPRAVLAGGGHPHDTELKKCTDFAGAKAAEEACKKKHNCTESCTDVNYGSDCAANTKEHCDEISCCKDKCTAEILAMFACEHGAACGLGELKCDDGAAAKATVANATSFNVTAPQA